VTQYFHATGALITYIQKDKFQATKFTSSLLKLNQHIFFVRMGESNHNLYATEISFFKWNWWQETSCFVLHCTAV